MARKSTKSVLEQLEGKISQELEDKHWDKFDKQAAYLGNGVYEFCGVFSTDTRELFLMGIAVIENIKYTKEP